MTGDDKLDAAAHRRRAGELMHSATQIHPLPVAEHERLLHELQVHQIELELQNEELVARRAEVEAGLERYTDLYDFAPVAYATLEADGTLTHTNVASERLLGHPRSKLEGQRLHRFVVTEDQHAFSEWLDQVFNGGDPMLCQIRLMAQGAAEDSQLTVQMDGKLSASRGGGCRAVLIDVTQRLAADAALRALELQLRESQKMEAIGTLAGGIAHDFNNILGAILGNVALAQQDVGEGHSAWAALVQIQQASMRARNLVHQILALSRRQPESPKPLALQPMVEETLALLRSTLPAGVQLQASLGDRSLVVMGDATKLQQVVMNLCTNAWQALPSEGGCIELQLDAVSPDRHVDPSPPTGLATGRYARLRVRDNGCGMDAATQSRVFEPFFTTKPVGSGTGLGLAVVHGIVTSMGGALGVHSAPGQGCSFEVWLPLLDAEAIDAVALVGAAPPMPAPDGQVWHVAYVDDDTGMLFMMERWLQRRGYRVSAFADPQVALEAVSAAPQSYDIVVTDFNMPGMSGLALAHALTALRPNLPIVLSSGYVSDELWREARRCGAREVIHKEETVDKLDAVLRGLLAQKAS